MNFSKILSKLPTICGFAPSAQRFSKWFLSLLENFDKFLIYRNFLKKTFESLRKFSQKFPKNCASVQTRINLTHRLLNFLKICYIDAFLATPLRIFSKFSKNVPRPKKPGYPQVISDSNIVYMASFFL